MPELRGGVLAMGRSQRDKGKRGEREALAHLRAVWGFDGGHRSAQVDGRLSSDLVLPASGLHPEVKFYKGIAALRFLEQAERDAQEGEVPFVVMRENGDKRWALMLRAADLPTLIERLMRCTP